MPDALSLVSVGVVGASDYQSAVRKFGPSRRMLEACLGLSLPSFVLDLLRLVLRDPDLLQAISRTAVAVVGYSINSMPDSPGWERVLVYPLHRRVAGRILAQIKTPIGVLEPPTRGTS